jgi:hypothetical protein
MAFLADALGNGAKGQWMVACHISFENEVNRRLVLKLGGHGSQSCSQLSAAMNSVQE